MQIHLIKYYNEKKTKYNNGANYHGARLVQKFRD